MIAHVKEIKKKNRLDVVKMKSIQEKKSDDCIVWNTFLQMNLNHVCQSSNGSVSHNSIIPFTTL